MRSRGGGGGAEPGGDVVYQGAILNIIEGSHPGLEQLLPGYDRTTTAVTDVSPASQGLDGEDITRFKVPEAAAEEEGDGILDITGQDFLSPSAAGIEVSEEAETDEIGAPVPAVVFRSYDIRGVVGDSLTEDGVFQIGRALGSEAAALNEKTVIVARDGRNSSEDLQASLVAGLRASGRDVLDIGLTPTPVLYFATHYLDAHSGVMITGSHNPPEYNGLKMVLGGKTLSGEAIQRIRERIEKQDFVDGQGSLQSTEIIPDYIRRISEEVPVSLGSALTVVVDAGNAVPGIVAPHILRAIGHDVIELYCDVDGNFPNHHPDPSQPENIADLVEAVKNEDADIGLAFDGDGDRLGVVTPEGNVIWPDRQMILFARDVLSRNPGAKIIYDVKCSRLLAQAIREAGGEPMMWKTGHSLIKSKMIETGALLAGEMSGHIFFKERWYGFDDALYAAARLLEILVNDGRPVTEIFDELPDSVTTPELRLDMAEEQHGPFMDSVKAAASFDDAELSTIDGLRVDFANGWGLIRASNTTPCLVMRFEGDDEAALAEVQEKFRGLLLGIDGSLQLPF
ncbi:MAG: phosphomannomutase/phosphoglucomutase [Gammaproteobacteria bacterium]|nr:phosphomannomutase/phosphoglucomutase [Gammaproteobacteria bacterium]